MRVHELRDSRYLTKDDVDPPVRVTIKDVQKENVAMEGEEPRDKFVMSFNELPKMMVLNMTNGLLVQEITGSDNSDNWKGCQVELYNDPSIFFGGKRVGGIRIRRVGGYAADATKHVDEDRRQAARERQANTELQAAASKRGHPDFPSIPEQEAYWARKEKEAKDDDGVPF